MQSAHDYIGKIHVIFVRDPQQHDNEAEYKYNIVLVWSVKA